MTWSPLSGCSVRNFCFIAMSLNMAVFPYSQITWTLPGPCFLLFMSFSLCLCSGPQGSFPLGTRSSVLRNVLPVHWPPPGTLPTVALKILRGHGKMYHASAVSLQSAVRGDLTRVWLNTGMCVWVEKPPKSHTEIPQVPTSFLLSLTFSLWRDFYCEFKTPLTDISITISLDNKKIYQVSRE